MLFKSLAILTAFVTKKDFALVEAHQAFEPDTEAVSLLSAEVIPGLEAYGVESYPDLPLPLTQDLFFDQIVLREKHSLR